MGHEGGRHKGRGEGGEERKGREEEGEEEREEEGMVGLPLTRPMTWPMHGRCHAGTCQEALLHHRCPIYPRATYGASTPAPACAGHQAH